MAKDKDLDIRLGEIKEGAGLEDSRINQEFIDFIRKWSTPVLLVAALLALGYFLNNKRIEARQAHIDEAFQQLNLSLETGSPSPDALRRIAEDFKDVEGVHLIATMGAADEYLRAVLRGIKPASPIDPTTGEFVDEADLLTAEDRDRFLSEAETLYKQVHAETVDKPNLSLHTLGALYGLAAVSESRGDLEAAQNVLEQAAALAEKHGYMEHSAIIQARIAALPTLGAPMTLVRKNDLPEIPALKPIVPEIPVIDGVSVDGPVVGPQAPEGEGDAAGEGDGGENAQAPPADETGEAGSQTKDDTTGRKVEGDTTSNGETSDDGGQ